MDVCVLWHLHQPDYRDPETGRPLMPWTRLHALRGYRDMAVEAAEQDLPWTLNLVPVLLDQLLYYAEGGTDRHLELTAAADPDSAEACALLGGGHDAMSSLYPRAQELRARAFAGERLWGQDLLDFQVWATLWWFGATAMRDYPVLGALRAKARDFTAADRDAMLSVQASILAELPAQLQRVPNLSTTPYFHPILPLVVDTDHAARNLPPWPDPVRYSRPAHALEHLTRSRRRMKELFDRDVVGLWPSEGSVSPEAMQLAAQAGYRWFCTDDGVLNRSERTGGPGGGPWKLDGTDLVGFFRDHDLSDRIGFVYASWDADEAADDLVKTIASRPGPLLLLALDGENPWETYADAGQGFRRALARRLGRHLVSLDDAANNEPVGTIQTLHTGSWINADFHIWFGHRDDRSAWRLLAKTVEAVGDHPDALEHVLAAEGSDWTWWFGADHHTPYLFLFDAAFRAHLRGAWRAAGLEPPAELERPVASVEPPRTPPVALIRPTLERPPTWEQWAGAGRIRWPGGSMQVAQRPFSVLHYGWDVDGRLWLRLDDPPPEVVVRLGNLELELDGHAAIEVGGVRAARLGGSVVVCAPKTVDPLWVRAGSARFGPVPLDAPSAPTLEFWAV